jgi:hypothetical protein
MDMTDKDQSQVSVFLAQQAEKKEEHYRRLKEDLDKERAALARNREYEDLMWSDKISDLEKHLREKQAEVAALKERVVDGDAFRAEKLMLQTDIDKLTAKCSDLERKHKDEIEAVDREAFQSSQRLKDLYEKKMADFKAKLEEERLEGLSAASKAILEDNVKMAKELNFHLNRSKELVKGKEVPS